MRPANFDSVARLYSWLEFAAFGRVLERARFVHLDHLRDCQDILLLGDGDGRALERILDIAASSRIVSIDASRRMLDLANRRVADSHRSRVTLQQRDARELSLAPWSLDAVVTQWFLDCFTADETAALVRAVAPAIRPGGIWLFADFAVPSHGVARFAAQAVTTSLYAFFRWRTGLSAQTLPPSETEIRGAGFVPVTEASFAGGMLRSVVFKKSEGKVRIPARN